MVLTSYLDISPCILHLAPLEIAMPLPGRCVTRNAGASISAFRSSQWSRISFSSVDGERRAHGGDQLLDPLNLPLDERTASCNSVPDLDLSMDPKLE